MSGGTYRRTHDGSFRRYCRRYAIPVAASVIVSLLIVGLSVVYYLATSVQNAFFDVIDVTGLLFSIFYIFTRSLLVSQRLPLSVRRG